MQKPALLLVAAAFVRCSSPTAPSITPDAAMTPAPPPWQGGLAATDGLYPARRGLRDVRGIIHLHSVRSWDACDDNPLPMNAPSPQCFADLRAALCTTHQDYAMITDHQDTMADSNWDDLFIPVAGDEQVMKNGNHVASWMTCADGHRVLLQVGGENETMPLGLEFQLAPDAATRHSLMGGTDAASIGAFRAANAVVAFAHTESKTLDELHSVMPDSVEVYNIHANIDPTILKSMGMDSTAPIEHLAPFLSNHDNPPLPDMAFLGLFEELPAETTKYQQLLSEGKHLTGTLGSDAHQNAFPFILSDGERGDSYRRMLRWFSNHLLVTSVDAGVIKDAIRAGRGYGLFEVFGPATGFDYYAQVGVTEPAPTIHEMGDTVALASAPLLVVQPPTVPLAPGQEAPVIKINIIRADNPNGTLVATNDGTTPLTYAPTVAGAYRVEVRVTPNQFKGYMGYAQSDLLREFVWIYANAIYVN